MMERCLPMWPSLHLGSRTQVALGGHSVAFSGIATPDPEGWVMLTLGCQTLYKTY